MTDMRRTTCLTICLAFALLPLAGAGPTIERTEPLAAAATYDPCPSGTSDTLGEVRGLLRADVRAAARARLGVTGVNYRDLRLLRSPEDTAVCAMIRSTNLPYGPNFFLTGDSRPDLIFGFYEAGGFYFVGSGPGPGIIRMGQPRTVWVFDSEGRFRGAG